MEYFAQIPKRLQPSDLSCTFDQHFQQHQPFVHHERLRSGRPQQRRRNPLGALDRSDAGVFLLFSFPRLRAYVIDIIGKKIDAELGSRLLSHVLAMRMEYKPASAGAFSSQMSGYESLRDLFTSATFVALIDFPFIFLFCWITYLVGGKLVFVTLAGLVLVIAITLLLRKPAMKALEESHLGVTQKQSILVEAITGLETIKAFSAEGNLIARWEKYTEWLRKQA